MKHLFHVHHAINCSCLAPGGANADKPFSAPAGWDEVREVPEKVTDGGQGREAEKANPEN